MKGFKVNNKLKKSIFSWIAIAAIFISIVSMSMSNVKADVAEKPNLKVNVEATPNPAHTGEDITVKTTITPEPFTRNASKQQIVMVLDVSGSMDYTVTGTKTKRIDALKTAAKNFIETVSNNIENLEICIVEYSTNAVINPVRISGNLSIKPLIGSQTHDVYNYISGGEIFYNARDRKSELLSMIDCLKAKGGTNMGEGLRKANYMLSQKGDSTAEKSIVFMTDGEPTHYSTYKGGYWPYYKYEYFTDINNATPGYSSTDENSALEYAKIIGANVKQNKYTAYSVGFAIDSNKLLQIHNSMGGKDSNYLITQNNINDAFNKIADTISSTVNVNDVQIVLNMEDFSVVGYEGNIIKLDNIVYTYNKQKKLYEADPIEFSFVIKGNSVGTYNPLKDSYLSYTVEGKQEKVPMGNITIKVNERKTPDINAELIDMSPSNVRPGDEVTVTYKISTEDFGYYLEDGSSVTKLSIGNAKLNLHLGDDFEAIENGDLTLNNGMYVYNIPNIEYVKTGETNSAGQAVWTQTNEGRLEVSFKVKVAKDKYGTLKFNKEEKSTLTYTNFAKDLITKNLATSEITSSNVTITHGVYYSMENGKPVIEPNTNVLNFAENTNVTLAAAVDNCLNRTSFELELAEGVILNGDIKVYSVDSFGNLNLEGIMTEVIGKKNTYSYILAFGEDAGNVTKNIVLMYTETLPSMNVESENYYSNILNVNGVEGEAKIQGSEKLPDLF